MKKNKILFIKIIILVLALLLATFGYFQNNQPSKSPLIPPTTESTSDERVQYVNNLKKTAIETDTIDISSCIPNPTVSTIKRNAELTLVNKNPVSHSISFNPYHTYTVNAESKKIIKADLGNTAGAFPFKCDSSDTPVGVVLIK